MSYIVQQTPEVERIILSWNLSKRLQDEIKFRLLDDLTDKPAKCLYTVQNEPSYMEYSFSADDDHADTKHIFVFRVVYSRDETSLVIINCDHVTVEA